MNCLDIYSELFRYIMSCSDFGDKKSWRSTILVQVKGMIQNLSVSENLSILSAEWFKLPNPFLLSTKDKWILDQVTVKFYKRNFFFDVCMQNLCYWKKSKPIRSMFRIKKINQLVFRTFITLILFSMKTINLKMMIAAHNKTCESVRRWWPM